MTSQDVPGASSEAPDGSPYRTGSPTDYRFGAADTKALQDLARVIKIAGILTLAEGWYGCIRLVAGRADPRLPPMVYLAMAIGGGIAGLAISGVQGLWTLHAGRAFGRVGAAKGDDITRLMAAVGSLERYFTFLKWLTIAGFAMTVCMVGLLGLLGILATVLRVH